MAWDRRVDPVVLYKRWEAVNGLLAPARFDPSPSDLEFPTQILATGITSVLSLASGRQDLWAAICLSTGYASESDSDPASAMFELAVSRVDDWPSTGASQFAVTYENLGWEPHALVNGARMLAAAVPYPLIALASYSIVDVETCFDLHGDDMEAVAECLKAAASARARLG
jgi:hypothetical protein